MLELIKRILRTNSTARQWREYWVGIKGSRNTAVKRFAEICIAKNVTVVMDVGANVGQFSRDLRRNHFKGTIFSFEPVHSTFQVLSKNFRNDSGWVGLQLGVGSSEGKLDIQISANSGLSTSFMDMESNHLENFPNSVFIGLETVEVTTLSKQISQLGIDPNSLAVKIDVQGFELEVLKGLISELKDVKCLLIEASLIPLYVGEPTFKELIDFLNLHNHEVKDMFRGVESNSGDLLQLDLITTSEARD
jgi:FkbM family methyltransferase